MSVRSVLAMTAAAAALFASVPASAATFIYSPGAAVTAVASNNDFKSSLAGLGYAAQSVASTVSILGKGKITFEFLGTESKYHDTFSYAGLPSYTEMFTKAKSYFSSPVNLGTVDAVTGPLLANFSAVGFGTRVGAQGLNSFALFLPTLRSGAGSSNVIYFGYDDKMSPTADDDYDDMIIRATITSAVPEPTVWAMLIAGFGLTGSALRSRRLRSLASI